MATVNKMIYDTHRFKGHKENFPRGWGGYIRYLSCGDGVVAVHIHLQIAHTDHGMFCIWDKLNKAVCKWFPSRRIMGGHRSYRGITSVAKGHVAKW